MTGYTQLQVQTLQGYITGAEQALANGDTQNALNYVELYYNSQTSMRGYATDTPQVVSDMGALGQTANNELANAVGATELRSIYGSPPFIIQKHREFADTPHFVH